MPRRILLVGARSRRQGTGPFLAAGLATAGATINGIVGTSSASVEEGQAQLAGDLGFEPNGYTSLDTALAEEQPEAVVIASPWRFHAAQLRQVAEAGCHCLVEKPLAWPAGEEEVMALVAGFERRGLLLQMVAQWPTTLAAFERLHGPLPSRIDSFRMRLSPISIGPDMVTDSAPHFISMLQALLGPGDCTDVTIDRQGDGALGRAV